ncbi:MAG: hypothetical protein ACJ8FN_10010 [Sphingomicrobium sp.]
MVSDQDDTHGLNATEVEREIREGRKFTANEAIARLAGPGAMKGASPVALDQQAEIAIGTWLRGHLADPVGALTIALHRHLRGCEALLKNPEQPLVVLADYCRSFLASDELLKELVREADAEWGRLMDERPHFEREGSPQHPDDPYTAGSVRKALDDVLRQLSP